MSLSITVDAKLDIPETIQAVDNDRFWLFASAEWWRLYQPYVPYQTGTMAQSVDLEPKKITHTKPYAAYQYNGKGFNFRTDENKLASAEWDKAAIPSQQDKLIQTMQNYINKIL